MTAPAMPGQTAVFAPPFQAATYPPASAVTPLPDRVAHAPATSATTSATVSWNPNNEPGLAGYRVYVGATSGYYTFAGPFEVSSGTSYTVTNLPSGATYYFAVSAFDTAGNESSKSAEVSKSLF
ncbi:MAG: fibronectin type III domain-containing protein [Nitrospira defluvii]|nr:fibronectin type III domain-containing protein [Nitrospira defluvii]